MDFDYWARVRQSGVMEYIDSRPWAYARKHPNAKGTNPISKAKAAFDYIYVYKKFFSKPSLSQDLRKIERSAFAVMHWHAARRLHRAGKNWRAKLHLIKSMILGPFDYSIDKLKIFVRWMIGLD